MRQSLIEPEDAADRTTDGLSERSPKPDVDVAAVREQTRRILEDPLFRNSKRYTDLLRFVVDRTLKGQMDDLHERIIGIEVFRRPPDYDTSIDPTVRVAATEVRKRLTLYYAGPAREHELRIEIPVRSYVAEFRPNKTPLHEPAMITEARMPEPESTQTQSLPPQAPDARKRIWYLATPAALAILLIIGWFLHRHLSSNSALNTFWAPVTEGSGSVVVCIGVATRSPAAVPPSQGALNSTGSANAADTLPPQRGTVPMSDVSAASTLESFLLHKGKDTVVVPANGTSLSDLRAGPAVLLGSFENEWTLRLGADLHYRFQRESDLGRRWIAAAANPTGQRWSVDLSVPQIQLGQDFALVSRIFDPTTGRWWIGIGGLTGLGTLAAEQTVTDQNAFATVAAELPKDWSRKNTQIVLGFQVVRGSPGVPQVVASDSW
jgi:hypothetical protein